MAPSIQRRILFRHGEKRHLVAPAIRFGDPRSAQQLAW